MSSQPQKEVAVDNDPESQIQEKTGAADADLAADNSATSEEQNVAVEPSKPPYNPWADPSSFPDGGTQAWLTVLGAFCCLFNSWGYAEHLNLGLAPALTPSVDGSTASVCFK